MNLLRVAVACMALLAFSLRAEDVDPQNQAMRVMVLKVKELNDKAANWVVDRFDMKEGTFGNSKTAKMPGVVGLNILALQEMNRHYRIADGPFISEPMKYLAKAQDEDGSFGGKEFGNGSYNTSLALTAMAKTESALYEKNVEKARKYLEKCQAKDGGFSYGPKDPQGGDLSNTWFALRALKLSGEKPDSERFKKAGEFVRKCQDNPETNPELNAVRSTNSGGAYYKPGVSEAGTLTARDGHSIPKPYGAMTAAAIESLAMCGLDAKSPEIAAALKWISTNYTVKDSAGLGQEGYYYYTMALARALSAAGVKEITLPDGRKVLWAMELATQLLSLQKPDGSFVNTEPRWLENDPLIATSYAIISLAICREELKKYSGAGDD